MNKVHERKKDFIEDSFCRAVKDANHDIEGLKYYVADNGEEFVTIAYRDRYAKLVNVTADSYNAMMRDVLAHLN